MTGLSIISLVCLALAFVALAIVKYQERHAKK